ncbi:hypothetical protein [Cellulomonas sp. Y8]|uniref:hypothetical protein n=1 Tax=Cellulomonas sp. Y8 TaxID=2591145 RepID=UPI003D708508
MSPSRPLHTSRTAVVGLALLALAVTGCTGDGGGGGPSSAGASGFTPGPLDEYMSRIWGYSLDEDRSTEDVQAENDRRERRVEELVAACMAEEGFDYTPADRSGSVAVSSDDLDVEWGSREFAEQYGYGISTDPWGNEGRAAEVGTWEDPNEEYVAAMSEGEAAAYGEALWGPTTEYDEEEPAEYDWTTSGCYGAAQHQVYEGGEVADEFAALNDEVERFWQTTQDDPRVADLDARWSSCMADAGYPGFTGADGARDDLYTEWWDLQGWDDPAYQALAEGWDWDAQPDGPPEPEVDEAATAAFRDREIAQAVVDAGCKEQIDYDAEWVRVYHELQEDFVDRHRDELEAWAAAATAAREG